MTMESLAFSLCSPVSSPCTRLLSTSSFSFMSRRQLLQPRLLMKRLPSCPQVRALETISNDVQVCVRDEQLKVIGIDSAQESVDAPDNAGHCQQSADDFIATWCQSCQALLPKALLKGSATASLGLFQGSSQGALADQSIEAGVQEAPDIVANSTLSILFIAAFLGLSVLTIGILYLSVQDFLEKRTLESESKAVGQEKKSRESREVVKAARSGPRGFGKRPKEDGKA